MKRKIIIITVIVLVALLVLITIVLAGPLKGTIVIAPREEPSVFLRLVEDSEHPDEEGIILFIVEAVVTGNPVPQVTFSRDDTLGELGSLRSGIILQAGETYELKVIAVNPLGEGQDVLLLSADQADDRAYEDTQPDDSDIDNSETDNPDSNEQEPGQSEPDEPSPQDSESDDRDIDLVLDPSDIDLNVDLSKFMMWSKVYEDYYEAKLTIRIINGRPVTNFSTDAMTDIFEIASNNEEWKIEWEIGKKGHDNPWGENTFVRMQVFYADDEADDNFVTSFSEDVSGENDPFTGEFLCRSGPGEYNIYVDFPPGSDTWIKIRVYERVPLVLRIPLP